MLKNGLPLMFYNIKQELTTSHLKNKIKNWSGEQCTADSGVPSGYARYSVNTLGYQKKIFF